MAQSSGQNSLVTLATLLVLGAIAGHVTLNLGGDIPALPRLTMPTRPPVDPAFDQRIASLFDQPDGKTLLVLEETQSPFFTRYFTPPKQAPKPKKIPVKKLKITYQGFYTTSSDDQKAFIVVDEQFKSVRVGEPIAAGLMLLSLDRGKIEIGNTNVPPKSIAFRETTTIEIQE